MIKDFIRLNGIVPFNDFFYCSCFYSALIPALIKFHIPPSAVLTHHLPFYKMFEERIISVEFRQMFSLEENLRKHGVAISDQKAASNLLEDIWNALNKECLLIMMADCFQLPYRKDTYQKQHLAHTLLLYGCDKKKKTVLALDHSHHDILDFAEYEIPISTLEKAFASYRECLESRLSISFSLLKLQRVGQPICEDKIPYAQYLSYRIYAYDDMAVGVKALGLFFSRLVESLEHSLPADTEEILDHFSYICKAKKGEVRLLEELNAGSFLISLSKEIDKLWLELGQALQYCVAKKRCTEKRLDQIRNNTIRLVLQEEAFCTELQEEAKRLHISKI